MSKKNITSRGGRFMKLAGMTATVAGRYASQRAKSVFSTEERTDKLKRETYTKMADDIVDTLGELKGAVMKIGQIASQTQDLLPKEFSDALQKLQKEAPPIEFSQIRKQIEDEFGKKLEELFQSFDKTPYASASIGQVHRAVTNDGEQVVVKVQYPGVDRSCDSDLKQLRLTLKLGGLIKMPKASVDGLFDEIKARLHEELDYENEAENLQRFREFHKDDNKVIIPEVINHLSSRHVLTLEFVPGDHIEDLVKENYPQETINELGYQLFKLLAEQLFVFKQIHGDPHPGNFAFRKDGSVIVYDFGCVKTLKSDIVDAYKDAISSGLDENYERLDEALIRLGARIQNKPSPGGDYYQVWRNIFFQPFLDQNEYNFKQAQLHIEAAKQTPLLFKHLSLFKPPVDSLYIDRMISGQYWIMKSMGVSASFRTQLQAFLSVEDVLS